MNRKAQPFFSKMIRVIKEKKDIDQQVLLSDKGLLHKFQMY